MVTTPHKSTWEININKFKDIVFVILFLVTTLGWITTSVSNKSDMKNELKNNTQKIEELSKQFQKVNEYINQQSELNGKIIQFMEMQKQQNRK